MKKFVLGLIVVLATLTGAQAQTSAHNAVLNWVNSVSSCVTNTNLHRVTVSGTEAIGTNFAVIPVATGHGYTDNTVVGGKTYFYTLSAYGPTCGGTGNESAMTAELTVAVPPDCNLPSTLVNGVCTAPPPAPTGLSLQSVQ